MSRPSEYADGATDGACQGPPNVYLPQADQPPAYDAYTDPAAAHGWQDAYDPADGQDAARGTGEMPDMGDTRELPPVPVPVHGRAGAGRHSRRRPAPWRARRAAVAVGAVGAVSAAALIAGLGFSDAPSGGTREGRGGRTGPTAGKSPTVPSTGTGRTPIPGTPLVGRPANSDEPSGPASASPSTAVNPTPSESGPDAPSPSAGTPTAGTPTTSAPAVTATPPGRSDGKPGHGPGGTKGPK
ncbi:hypothetical protein QF034_005179 [Streptomyces africanus]|uniref:Uncharacterized protein n=1 Tax=Streptomyces africanus TaxID=231024 RepID=A0ABU0QU70_9ACTN|nr:hypothetical protein [Streptomyces africanus]MDQ0750948.1 hypothetical protein [Streptomyces africanus]